MLAPVIGARRVRLLLSALVLPGLSGCVSLRQQRLAPGEEPVLIGAAARDNRTPMDPAFACFSAELSAVRHKPVVIAVGDVGDFTGKYSVSEGTARASTVPSIAMATAFLTSDLEMDSATSRPVVPASKVRTLPSGKVRETAADMNSLLVSSPANECGW